MTCKIWMIAPACLAATAGAAWAQDEDIARITRETVTVIEERVLGRDRGPARPAPGQALDIEAVVSEAVEAVEAAEVETAAVETVAPQPRPQPRLPANAPRLRPSRLTSPARVVVNAAVVESDERRVEVVDEAGECGGKYTVRSGDTLSAISARIYEDVDNWSLIFYANQQVLTEGPSLIYVGTRLTIPCLTAPPAPAAEEPEAEAEVVAAAAEPPAGPRRGQIKLLTAGDYPPFTDQDMEAGGMFTEIIETAFREGEIDYRLTWVNDWSAHLQPLLSEQAFDMGFPWFKPDCEATPDNMRCKEFFFSEPVFEVLIMLYSRVEDPVAFTQDSDIEGLTLCRPAGYFTFDLDQDGRNWVSEGKITLEQPQAVSACYEMLLSGEVDAVALNEFTGRQTIAEMDIGDQVTVADRALSIPALRLVIHKTHPRARPLLYRFDEALGKLQDSGVYQEIVSRHLRRYWAEIEG